MSNFARLSGVDDRGEVGDERRGNPQAYRLAGRVRLQRILSAFRHYQLPLAASPTLAAAQKPAEISRVDHQYLGAPEKIFFCNPDQ